ncbi:MAG: hypothetical protein GY883_24990 [Shimia sp.]|nr:hypothetical protein [Shimia sp.]
MTKTPVSHSVAATVLSEGRHAVLSQPAQAKAAPGVPVVIVMPLTAPCQSREFANEARLISLLNAASHPVGIVSWRHLWERKSKERFSPRVNDLAKLLCDAIGPGHPVHLATIGNAALVTLKWLTSLAGEDSTVAPQVSSLSLIAPELHIFDRIPRTTLRDAPNDCCVIADGARPWADTCDLANKLPVTPNFALAQDHCNFLLSDDDRNPDEDILSNAAHFEGDWRLSWADWLHRVHRRHQAGDDLPRPTGLL